jgi:PAS domain S-box-containing protein
MRIYVKLMLYVMAIAIVISLSASYALYVYTHKTLSVAFAPSGNLKNSMILLMALICLISLITAWLFSRAVSKPVTNIKTSLQRVSRGQFDARLEVVAKDEFGEIMASINAMAEQLSATTVSRDTAQRYLDIASVMIVVLNRKGEIEVINKKGCETLGYAPEELSGKDWFKTCLPADINDEVRTVFDKLIRGEVQPVEHYRNSVVTRNFQKRIIAWHNNVIRDGEGAITHILSSGEDITDKLRAEQAVLESEEKYRKLVESANDALLLADIDGNLTGCNRKAEELFGYSRDEFMKMHFTQLHPAEEIKRNIGNFREVSEKGGGTIKKTHILRKDGVIIPVDISASDFTYAGKTMHHAFFRDLTGELRYQAELVRSEKLATVGELAADVAHEINNPIFGIMNYAQLIMDANAGDSASRRFAMEIMNEGERIARIVQNLLSFSRAGSNEKHRIEARKIIDGAMDLITAQLKKDSIIPKYDLPGEPLYVCANLQEMLQVLLNVLQNARYALNEKYPPSRLETHPEAHKDKIIEISLLPATVDDKPCVEIRIVDRGAGIAEEHVGRVMEPFFTTKSAPNGTGLGLSICSGIVSNHNGRISVESQKGSFTRVSVYLPRIEQTGEKRDDKEQNVG